MWEDGRTPREISDAAGVSVYVVYEEMATTIADILDVSVLWLLGRE